MRIIFKCNRIFSESWPTFEVIILSIQNSNSCRLLQVSKQCQPEAFWMKQNPTMAPPLLIFNILSLNPIEDASMEHKSS